MKQASIFWFTGLSGSGKTTIATGVKRLLEADAYSVWVLGGDDVRRRLHSHPGFTEQDIIDESINDFYQFTIKKLRDYASN